MVRFLKTLTFMLLAFGISSAQADIIFNCSTYSNGLSFFASSPFEQNARNNAIVQCQSRPYSNWNECFDNVRCSFYETYPTPPPYYPIPVPYPHPVPHPPHPYPGPHPGPGHGFPGGGHHGPGHGGGHGGGFPGGGHGPGHGGGHGPHH